MAQKINPIIYTIFAEGEGEPETERSSDDSAQGEIELNDEHPEVIALVEETMKVQQAKIFGTLINILNFSQRHDNPEVNLGPEIYVEVMKNSIEKLEENNRKLNPNGPQ